MRSSADKAKLIHRLRRIAGQVQAIERMIDRGEECGDILMQISAASGALGKVGQLLLEDHLEEGISEALRSGKAADKDRFVEELVGLLRKHGDVFE